ncbi:MAG TPA: peptide ABC transporter substrate-binding protein, partial [Clostridia bacterium]
GYSNSQVDSCLENLLTENDPVMKKAQFLNMKSIIVDEVPYIGLYFYSNAIVCNKKIRGDVNPYLWNIYNIPKWYIPVG